MTTSEHKAENGRRGTTALPSEEAVPPRPFLQIIGSSVKLVKKVVAGFLRARFRGEIYDYARLIGELGSGYLGDWRLTNLCIHCKAAGKAQCAHFEISTARHLMGPFKAILDPNVKVVMLLKAAQTAGSTVWDLTVHYLLVHSPFMRIKVLMDSNEKAQDYCQQKLMETLRRNPDIKPLLPTGADRFGVTDTELRLLNGKILTVAGLNETNASSLPSDVMILDEGWIHQSDGLMKKAFMRLKQTKRGKIIVVGQAGNVKEDQDVIWNELDARIPLTWACPCCGGRQQFELHKARPERFTPRAPLVSAGSSGNLPCEYLFLPKEVPMAGSHVGFKIPKKISELTTSEEIKAACALTVIECFHCGFEIQDTRPLRQLLNDSFEQEYRLTAPDGSLYTPDGYTVGFWNPDPASMFVSFKETMEAYVHAVKARELRGNLVPLRDFYLSRWAKAWDENILADLKIRRQDAYDVALAKHDAWRLCMIVDNQLDLMTQWVMVLAVKKNGSVKQLWRGALHGLAEVRKKQLEYVSAEGKPLIKDQFVFLDGRHKGELICRHIVEHKYGHWATMDGERVWLAWNLMMGSGYEYFTHADEGDKTRKFVCGDWTIRNFTLDGNHVEIWSYPFSATMCGQRFEGLRDLAPVPGEEPMLSFLERLPEEPADDHELSHHSQINSNKLVMSKSFAPRMAKQHYVPVPASRADHYFHMWRMMMAVLEIWQVDGIYQEATAGKVLTTAT